MLIGARKSGKTTLSDWINGTKGAVNRAANIRYDKWTIDIPGAYLECPWMHCHLISAAQDAFCVLMLVDQSYPKEVYPPGFAKSFRMPVLGVITKSDQHMERRGLSTQQLKRAGIAPPYYCVTKEEENFLELKKVIMQLVKRGEA